MADHQRYHLTFDVLRSRKNTCIVMGVLENVQDQVMVQRDTSSRCGVETKYGCPKWNLALTWTLHGSVAYKRNLRGGEDQIRCISIVDNVLFVKGQFFKHRYSNCAYKIQRRKQYWRCFIDPATSSRNVILRGWQTGRTTFLRPKSPCFSSFQIFGDVFQGGGENKESEGSLPFHHKVSTAQLFDGE